MAPSSVAIFVEEKRGIKQTHEALLIEEFD